MEARLSRIALVLFPILFMGAGYRTQNFIVDAPDQQFAMKVAQEAERFRRELAIEWLGHELPPWRQPCPIYVIFEQHPRGMTSFRFRPGFRGKGEPFDWKMVVNGPPQRILDAVLPHEVTHTIFATHFGQPLPRWADEGACTTVEHISERQKYHRMLIQFLLSKKGIPFNAMFRMKQYPDDMLPLYAQGHSVARFLIAQGGRKHFVKYIESGLQDENWDRATREFYGYTDLSDLQKTWNNWVAEGSPKVQPRSKEVASAPAGTRVASASTHPQGQQLNLQGPIQGQPTQQAPVTQTIPVDQQLVSTANSSDWYFQQKQARQRTTTSQHSAPAAASTLANNSRSSVSPAVYHGNNRLTAPPRLSAPVNNAVYVPPTQARPPIHYRPQPQVQPVRVIQSSLPPRSCTTVWR